MKIYRSRAHGSRVHHTFVILCCVLAVAAPNHRGQAAPDPWDKSQIRTSSGRYIGSNVPQEEHIPSQVEDTANIYLPLIISVIQADFRAEIDNGDFELGSNGDWVESWVAYPALITDEDLPLTPHSGGWIAWMGGIDNEENHLSQAVSLPADSPNYLKFYYQTHSDEASCGLDLAGVFIDQAQVHVFNLCAATNTSAWLPVTLDLSAYAGETVVIKFSTLTNGSTLSSVVVDDVSLSATP